MVLDLKLTCHEQSTQFSIITTLQGRPARKTCRWCVSRLPDAVGSSIQRIAMVHDIFRHTQIKHVFVFFEDRPTSIGNVQSRNTTRQSTIRKYRVSYHNYFLRHICNWNGLCSGQSKPQSRSRRGKVCDKLKSK